MSRPHRDGFKLADDDGATNDFIANIAKTAPRKKASVVEDNTIVDRGSNNEPWTSDIYTRLNGDGSSRRKGEGHTCLSVLVMAFSILLMLAGGALIVVAAIQKSQKLLPICPACNKTVIGMYIVGAFVIFVGVIGVLAAKTRNKLLAVPYCILLFIIGLIFLGLTVLVVVFITNTNGLHLEEAWITEVKDDPENICELQSQWKCSGYTVCCNGVVTNESATTTTAYITTSTTSTGEPTSTTLASTTTSTTASPTTTTATTTTTTFTTAETTTTPFVTTSTAEATTTTSTTAEATTTTSTSTSTSTSTTATTTTAATTSTTGAETTTVTTEVTTSSSSTETITGAFKGFFAAEDNTTTSIVSSSTTSEETTAPSTTAGPYPHGGSCYTATGIIPKAVTDQCISGCAANVYETRCDSALKSKLKDNLAYILAALIPATLVAALMCFFSIRMTRVDRYLE